MDDNSGLVAVVILFYVVIIAVAIIANWKIWSKAGYAGAWSLLLLVPLVGIVAYLWFAFSEWPVTKKVRALEGGGQAPPVS
jgi:hypothetical protein